VRPSAWETAREAALAYDYVATRVSGEFALANKSLRFVWGFLAPGYFYLLRKYTRAGGGLANLAPGGPGRGWQCASAAGKGRSIGLAIPMLSVVFPLELNGSAGWPCPGTTSGYRRDESVGPQGPAAACIKSGETFRTIRRAGWMCEWRSKERWCDGALSPAGGAMGNDSNRWRSSSLLKKVFRVVREQH
jgi:hypothetical protein